MLLALFIFIRLLGSIDKIVLTVTLPSLPSPIILKKHFLLSFFNIPGQIKIKPIENPTIKKTVLINLLIFDFLLLIKNSHLTN